MAKTVAFFDIDGTIFRDSLVTSLYKKLLKYELIDKKDYYSQIEKPQLDWENRISSYEEYLEALTTIFSKSITGKSKADLDFITNQVMKTQADKVYTYTRDRIKYHKANGDMVVFISGSPDFIVEKMGEKYGADLAIGSSYIFDEEDNFTGKIIPMWDSKSKNKTINKLVKEYDLDLKNSFAYGDTNGDALMLSKVGNPIAINPNQELLSRIMTSRNKNKYKIVIERKDVIYTLTPELLS